jgi:adenylate cyclase
MTEKNNQEPLEIERKFLIRELPETLAGLEGEQIFQGYLAVDSNHTVVRLRQRGDKYYLTVKGAGKISRKEWEAEIPEDQFKLFWPATDGRRLEKTRYEIPGEGVIVELDIFSGNLQGLVTAEVEFDSEEEAEKFVPPEWLTEEVTEDDRFKNNNLINLNPEQLKEILEK